MIRAAIGAANVARHTGAETVDPFRPGDARWAAQRPAAPLVDRLSLRIGRISDAGLHPGTAAVFVEFRFPLQHTT